MKYASFLSADRTPTWGVVVDETVFDLGPSGLGLAPDLRTAIADGVFGSVDEQHRGAPARPVGEVELLPVIPDPAKILCIGVNYRTHQQETGKGGGAAAPTVFTRFADTQVGAGQSAVMPASTTQFDYEGELAVVIGTEAFHVSADDAWEHVAGYAAYNDFTARDWQRATSQWIPGKNFPGTGAFGPYLVPAADIDDVDALALETRVNGDVRQKASLADLDFSIPRLIEHVTGFTRLAPGDVIVTGTPGGVGLFMDPPGLLSEGDVVEVEITGLGVLRNVVVRES
jgi:2-keto-4-pentenoate hydratase/2-oxohepta-3-ene-1,7-dioic acid hydratase in catechol pathway